MEEELKSEIIEKFNIKKKELSSVLEKNKKVIAALGIASFMAIGGYSAAKMLKKNKPVKKLGKGVKSPVAKKIKKGIDSKKLAKVLKKVTKKAKSKIKSENKASKIKATAKK